MRIPAQIIAQIRAAANIVAILQCEGVNFKLATGRRRFACCPFHREDTPSFCVDLGRQTFKCFGGTCGHGGDIFRFFQIKYGDDFPAAVRRVAEYTNQTYLLP